jgi:drug/metabolite transporter (DMT)-like permease
VIEPTTTTTVPQVATSVIGPAAGVATAILWSFTAIFFTAAGKRIGATVVNATRIFIAIGLLGVTHRLMTGLWIPDVTLWSVLYLAGSGIVGLTIGDLALFTAFVLIGPRLSMLIMTSSPIFAALFGWIALGEMLSGVAWLGMLLTIAGIAWVVLERPAKSSIVTGPGWGRGILLAFIGAACQSAGLWMSKAGIGHGWLPRDQHLDPQTATLVRMFFAGVFAIPTVWWYLARSRAAGAPPRPKRHWKTRRTGYLLTLCGAIVGPFLGVWMSLIASDNAPLGIAQTTCSLTPIFVLPLVIWIHREHVSPRAALGAVVAVAGTALLFVPAAT